MFRKSGNMRPSLCNKCKMVSECKFDGIMCEFMEMLIKEYRTYTTDSAKDKIAMLRPLLSEEDAEESETLTLLGNSVISAIEELNFINDYEIKIGYVLCYEEKVKNGKMILADCRKVTNIYSAYIPFDFIITFYEPNICHLSENHKKVLMWHELKHIGINDKTLKTEYKIVPHDIEDFYSITDRFGTRWEEIENIDDILGGIE